MTESNGVMNGSASQKAADPKIIDLLSKPQENGEPFVSIEYFPPRTDDGVKNLKARMERMLLNSNPLFSDITWGAGGSTASLTLDLAKHLHQTGHVANMHLTCTNMSRDMLVHALQDADAAGIRNIVALRGDPPAGAQEWKAAENGFACALDLVKYIRQEFGASFGISVAGYPEGHPDAITEVSEEEDLETLSPAEKARSSVRDGKTYVCKDDAYNKEMQYLKSKIDAGGDFIITQMFFDTQVFLQFVKDCRAVGIDCPIVPGIMCINAYAGFVKMTKFCKTRVPEWLAEKMESLKDDAAAVKEYGIEFGVEMCKQLVEGGAPCLHFYTLNLERAVYGITDGLGYTDAATREKNMNGAKLDADASTMVAVGSAWARVGDSVKSVYGVGTVSEIRKEEGVTVVRMDSWELAGGQKPVLYLQQGSFEKKF